MTPPYLLVAGAFVRTGGMDLANLGLASYLARCGREVHLVAHQADPQLLGEGRVFFHRAPKPRNAVLLGEPFLRWAGMLWAARLAARNGRVVVNGGNCPTDDVNWVHYVHAVDAPGMRPMTFKDRLQRAMSRRNERRCVRRASIVVANSRRTARDVIDRLAVAPERVHTVYLGGTPPTSPDDSVTVRRRIRTSMGWAADRPVVTFVGALGDRRKGFDTLFAAWQRLASYREWDGLLCVVGTGRDLPRWRVHAAQAGLASSIHFLGFRTDVPDILRGSDLLVSPARYEAYGLGVREALSLGVPAFVTSAAGVAEHYPPDLADYLLADPDDAAALSERLVGWRKDIGGYRERISGLSHLLRSRTWDDMAVEMLAITGRGA